MTDPQMPDSLAARPRDRRGLPIPAVIPVIDGTPDFTAVDSNKSLAVGRQRRCGLCERPLEYWIAFLGGPNAYETRAYVDPPMHPECAEAATRLCPHIAKRAPKRSKNTEGTHTPEGFMLDKPEVWVLAVTRTYSIVITEDGGVIFRPAPFRSTRRFTYDEAGQLQEEIA